MIRILRTFHNEQLANVKLRSPITLSWLQPETVVQVGEVVEATVSNVPVSRKNPNVRRMTIPPVEALNLM
jgi:hypothetical protein